MSASLPILNMAGKNVGTLDVPSEWLEREKGAQAVQDAVVAWRAGARAGTASTKTRSQVRGGGAKPWRQKGTGRARAGSNTSPVWRGGGTTFGPQFRSYAKKINKKVRRLAMRRILAERIDGDSVIVIDNLSPETTKTKAFAGILDAVGAGQDVLIIADTSLLTSNLVLASRNIPTVNLLSVDGVSAYHMLLHPKVIFTKEALEQLGARITSAPAPAAAEPAEEA
jgi:large subunit ribosomal protein L4